MVFEVPQNYRKRPRQARSRRTVGALLDATETVVRTHGYEGASTNRIARAAGLSVGSLYQYFGDKDGLIGAALERTFTREAETVGGLAEELRGYPLQQGASRVVDAIVQRRSSERALLSVIAEHGLRFGHGTTLQLIARMQRGHPDALQRLLVGRRAELREAPIETLRFSAGALLNAASFAYAVAAPGSVRPQVLAGLVSAAIAQHLQYAPERAHAPAPVRAFDVARVRTLLEESCRSSTARAQLMDELVFEEQCTLDALCAAGSDPESICEGMLRFWASSGRALAQAAGAASLAGPSLDPEAAALRAERRSRRVRIWLQTLHEGSADETLEAAIFVLGHAFLEVGLLLAQSREPSDLVEERLADTAALLGTCARLPGSLQPAALTGATRAQ